MIRRGSFRTVFCTGFILTGLILGVNVYAAAPAPAEAVQPTSPPAAAAPAPAAVTPTPIPASQAAATLSVEDIIALAGHPRLNTSPVVSLAPVVTTVPATASPVTVDLIRFTASPTVTIFSARINIRYTLAAAFWNLVIS